MSKVCEKWENQLSLALLRAIREIQLGKSRRDAMRDMADRIGLAGDDQLRGCHHPERDPGCEPFQGPANSVRSDARSPAGNAQKSRHARRRSR